MREEGGCELRGWNTAIVFHKVVDCKMKGKPPVYHPACLSPSSSIRNEHSSLSGIQCNHKPGPMLNRTIILICPIAYRVTFLARGIHSLCSDSCDGICQDWSCSTWINAYALTRATSVAARSNIPQRTPCTTTQHLRHTISCQACYAMCLAIAAGPCSLL